MKNLINGYKDGSFKPKNNMTRGELAALVRRISNINNIDMSNTQMPKVSFKDIEGK